MFFSWIHSIVFWYIWLYRTLIGSSPTVCMSYIKNNNPIMIVNINLLIMEDMIIFLFFDGILLYIIVDKRFHTLMYIAHNYMIYIIFFPPKMQEHMITADDYVWFVWCLFYCVLCYSTSQMFSYQSMTIFKSSFMQCWEYFFRFFTIVRYDKDRSRCLLY